MHVCTVHCETSVQKLSGSLIKMATSRKRLYLFVSWIKEMWSRRQFFVSIEVNTKFSRIGLPNIIRVPSVSWWNKDHSTLTCYTAYSLTEVIEMRGGMYLIDESIHLCLYGDPIAHADQPPANVRMIIQLSVRFTLPSTMKL
jgi:hypothetical protein